MKKILFCRFFVVAVVCLASPAIKSEQKICKSNCCKLATTRLMVEPKFEFTSYERGPLPLEDGFIIKI